MRRSALAASAVLGLVLGSASFPVSAAWATPSPAPVASAVPGQVVCDVDSALAGITGLAATASGYAVVVKPESGLTQRVYLLDADCKRGKSLTYSGAGPNSPQDVQVTPDGTLWVADTGDNLTTPTRKSVGVWKFPADGKSVLFRFTYPDGPRAAQALLIGPDGNPILIADNAKGPAGLYVPDQPLDPTGKAVPLKHVGDFTPQATGTDNTLGKIGQSRVSGAATSPDGKKVVLRTYSDAYEWTVANGDVVGAITAGTPRITPLPGEPLGEAITYSKDGANFLTVSDVINKQSSTPVQILKYQPAAPVAVVQAKTGGATGPTSTTDTRDWLGKLGLQEILNIVIGIGVIGVLMVVIGIVGIRRSRKSPPAGPASGRGMPAYDDGYGDPDDPRAAARARVEDRRRARVPERYETNGYDQDDYRGQPYESKPYESQPYESQPYDSQTYGSSRYGADDYPPPEPEPPYAGYHPDGYPAPPRPAPPNPAPRGDRGIARTHRPGRRGVRDDDRGGRGGYSDEHQGFGDMLE